MDVDEGGWCKHQICIPSSYKGHAVHKPPSSSDVIYTPWFYSRVTLKLIILHISFPSDYDPDNVPASVTIPGDQDRGCFTTDAVLDDEVALEDEETFVLNAVLDDPIDDRIAILDGTLDVFILDDDSE